MGPGAKLDPLVMLNEAKRICDALLANPSQLVANPPPPMYPPLPTLYSSGNAPPPSTSPASTSAAPVITNAQSFVVPLGGQAPGGYVSAAPQYPMFATPGQYATAPYYQYPYGPPPPPPPGFYPPQQPQQQQQQPQPQPAPPPPQPQPVASTSTQGTPAAPPAAPPPGSGSSSGAWTDEETERLRRLAEDSKGHTANGEIDWDHVIRHFGEGRTRHQILIKATSMGLKESSTRVPKRRRENDSSTGPAASSGSPAPQQHQQHEHQHSATPHASPAMQNMQRPGSAQQQQSGAATSSGMPWPMPTVAMNTASPIIPSSSSSSMGEQQQQRASYYRPRPTDSANKQVNPYSLFTANGHSRDGR